MVVTTHNTSVPAAERYANGLNPHFCRPSHNTLGTLPACRHFQSRISWMFVFYCSFPVICSWRTKFWRVSQVGGSHHLCLNRKSANKPRLECQGWERRRGKVSSTNGRGALSPSHYIGLTILLSIRNKWFRTYVFGSHESSVYFWSTIRCEFACNLLKSTIFLFHMIMKAPFFWYTESELCAVFVEKEWSQMSGAHSSLDLGELSDFSHKCEVLSLLPSQS